MSKLETPYLPTPYQDYTLMTRGSPYAPSFAFAAATWQSANLAIYQPFTVPADCQLSEIRALGTNTTGNYDLGIYDELGTRLASKGSTAMAAATLSFTTELHLFAGAMYYLAMACSSASSGMFAASMGGVYKVQGMGLAIQTSAFALPSSWTPTVQTSDFIPLMAAVLR